MPRIEPPPPPASSAAGRRAAGLARTLAGPAALFLVLFLAWVWFFWRIHVPAGHTLVVTRVLGSPNPDVDLHRVIPGKLGDVKGILEEVRGEGYHFYNPILYDTNLDQRVLTLVPPERNPLPVPPPTSDDAVHPQVEGLSIGVVKSNSGRQPPPGVFLVDTPAERGVLRRVLTPGTWRTNPAAYEVRVEKATVIQPGYVGVITNQTGRQPKDDLAGEGEAGIQREVLQPGIYFLNPLEKKVDVLEVGFRQLTLNDIQFPSRDGFPITCDITVVWGIHPRNAPHIVKHTGRTDQEIVKRVINQAVQSASRIEGSKFTAAQLVSGTEREVFITQFTNQLAHECTTHKLDILIGLIRDITIPEAIRKPIQGVQIQKELQDTLKEEERTQAVRNELEKTKGEVARMKLVTQAETEKLVAEERQKGLRQVAEIRARGEKEIAEILARVAAIEASAERERGQAEAQAIQLEREAEADRFTQVVAAFGTPEAYTRYVFAQNLPSGFAVVLRYAGPGTFWTDLPRELRSLERAAALKVLEQDEKAKGGRK